MNIIDSSSYMPLVVWLLDLNNIVQLLYIMSFNLLYLINIKVSLIVLQR